MTDLEKMKSLFTELGIEEHPRLDWVGHEPPEGHSSIVLPHGKGYVDFFVRFNFDEEGKFTNYGVWE